jgi:hypothetical protein
VNGVIIVAPAEARWPGRAQSVLADARLFVARLYEPGLLPLLLRSGGVRAVAIDIRTRLRSGAMLRECAAVDPAVQLVLVHEDQPPATLGTWHSHAWPEEPAAMLALVRRC